MSVFFYSVVKVQVSIEPPQNAFAFVESIFCYLLGFKSDLSLTHSCDYTTRRSDHFGQTV